MVGYAVCFAALGRLLGLRMAKPDYPCPLAGIKLRGLGLYERCSHQRPNRQCHPTEALTAKSAWACLCHAGTTAILAPYQLGARNAGVWHEMLLFCAPMENTGFFRFPCGRIFFAGLGYWRSGWVY